MGKAKEQAYRKGVGIVIFNRQGEVLVGERTGHPNAWQFPQGGIDEGEKPKSAAMRELYEEVGITDTKFVEKTENWLSYDFPADLDLKGIKKDYKGQKQKWFLVYWDRPVAECNLEVHEREFDRVKFMPFASTLDYIVGFKKPLYEQLMQIFQPSIDEYIKSLDLAED